MHSRMHSHISPLEQFDRINALGDELATLPAAAGHALPTATHVAALDVLTELMALGQQFSTTETPLPLRVVMTTLDKSRPMLLDMLANVPEEQIRAFMGQLAARIQVIVDTPPSVPVELEVRADDHRGQIGPSAVAG